MVMEEQESNVELASERIPVPQVQQPKMDMIKRNSRSAVSRVKPRLRKKALHAAILRQMEFYFSDANLNKDRYLSELLKKNPYVDLDVFANFNKLSALTTDTNRIAKALQRSTILKVSEDGTKVCRLTPINKKENTDECTVYVQNLPPDSDHDWLISAFSKYGTVVYVSIPRYKSNKKIKGFAFVEFDTPVGAEQCIKAFQEEGCVLPSHTSPNDLLSITTFNNTEENLTIHNESEHLRYIPEETVTTGTDDQQDNIAKDPIKDGSDIHDEETGNFNSNIKHSQGKRKLITDENGVRIKKRRTTADQNIVNQRNSDMENQEISNKDIKDTNRIKPMETDRKRKKRSSISDTFKSENTTEGTVKRDPCGSAAAKLDKDRAIEMLGESYDDRSEKKAVLQTAKYPTKRDIDPTSSNIKEKETGVDERKKKKNRKKRNNFQRDITSDMMQVMAKRDWKRLRNKYLELQKSKMQQLKLHLRKARWNYDKAGQNYDKPKHEKDEKNNETEKSCYGRTTYAPGIIVKIEMDDPCVDPQGLKMELRGDKCVKYIDVTHGSCEAYIRCDTAEAAESFVRKNPERHLTILKGNEEESYWNKIEQDRKEKLHNKKRFKHRGRDKLLKRAEKELGKYIKFDQV